MTVATATSRTTGNSAAANTTIKDRPKRAFATHIPKWQRFQSNMIAPSEKASSVSKQESEAYAYNKQYSHVYMQRLTVLKPRCWRLMMADSKNYTRVNRVLELREDVPSMIVGTLVKEPSDGGDSKKEDPILPNTECRESDQLFLEDGSGRVALIVKNVHEYCTGVVVGVKGKVDKMGALTVEELVVPDPFPHPKVDGNLVAATTTTTTTTLEEESQNAPHLLIVSSLLCGDPNVSSLPREMLVSYLQGHFTDDAAKVARVLLAGAGPSHQEPLNGIKELDGFCLQVGRIGIPLDAMPSKMDPTTVNWPQRPLHSSLLPHATNSLSRTPNPYAAAHGNQYVVATDGVNVKDLQRYVLNADKTAPLSELEALERTLEWGHLCPTGPSSVPTVPHVDADPMLLEQRPHIYVCGNASEFATKTTSSGTTLICVPKFSETGEAVLVNLETKDVRLLRFEDGEQDQE